MTRRIMVIFGLAIVLGASESAGEWKMEIHRGGLIDEFSLADIDSVTFRDVVPEGMVYVPPSNVRMGQTGIATPVHDFYVEGYYIDRYEVSNARYKAFIDAGGYQNAAYWSAVGWAWRVTEGITLPYSWDSFYYHGGGIAGNEGYPVMGVSWWEADAYCRWAGRRLPTEAEWEKAAKGGCETHGEPGACDASDTPTYPWGEDISGPRANYVGSGDPDDDSTTPVGYYDGGNHSGYQTQDSPSPYGLYDVAGDLMEWSSTKNASYPYNPNDGRENPPAAYDEPYRILRGGSWSDASNVLKCARRNITYPNSRGTNFGFRCAMTH